MWCATPNARCWWCGIKRRARAVREPKISSVIPGREQRQLRANPESCRAIVVARFRVRSPNGLAPRNDRLATIAVTQMGCPLDAPLSGRRPGIHTPQRRFGRCRRHHPGPAGLRSPRVARTLALLAPRAWPIEISTPATATTPSAVLERVARGWLRRMKPPTCQANRAAKPTQKQRAAEFAGRDRARQQCRSSPSPAAPPPRARRAVDRRPRPPVSAASLPASLHPPMQRDDEGAVVVVLRRHQRHGLPGGRERRAMRSPAGRSAMSARNRRDCIDTGRYDSRIAAMTGIGPDPGLGRRPATTARHRSVRIDARAADQRRPCRRSGAGRGWRAKL